MNGLKCTSESEQCIQHILEEHSAELDEFLFDHAPNVDRHRYAKALVSFCLARHLAMKAIEKGE